MSYPTKDFQERMLGLLRAALPQDIPSENEWRSFQNISELYCPRIDIAIGPYAENTPLIDIYDNLLIRLRRFVERSIDLHLGNLSEYGGTIHYGAIQTFDRISDMNRNSRCFMAIEIENQVSRKHLLGGIINASALGRIGILIGWTEEKIKALIRQREYFNYLTSVGKNSFDTSNVLILNPEQFELCISQI